MAQVRFSVLKDCGDQRGSSFQTGSEWLAFLGSMDDAHIATILPGAVRGNHYHRLRREAIAVLFTDAWRLAWDRGEGTEVIVHDFSGAGAVTIEADPLAAHAIANTGRAPLWIVALSHGAWDPVAPDSYPRRLLPLQV